MSVETTLYFHYVLMQNARKTGFSKGNEIKGDLAEMWHSTNEQFKGGCICTSALIFQKQSEAATIIPRSALVLNKLLYRTLTVADYTSDS